MLAGVRNRVKTGAESTRLGSAPNSVGACAKIAGPITLHLRASTDGKALGMGRSLRRIRALRVSMIEAGIVLPIQAAGKNATQ